MVFDAGRGNDDVTATDAAFMALVRSRVRAGSNTQRFVDEWGPPSAGMPQSSAEQLGLFSVPSTSAGRTLQVRGAAPLGSVALPPLWSQGVSSSDIRQGALGEYHCARAGGGVGSLPLMFARCCTGDCWLLAAMAVLADGGEGGRLVRQLFISDASDAAVGLVAVRLYSPDAGAWRRFALDYRFPVICSPILTILDTVLASFVFILCCAGPPSCAGR